MANKQGNEMARTAPVTWEEMVAKPVEGGMRILGNQIADRDDKIDALRDALEDIAEGIWPPETEPHAIIGQMRDIAKKALGG